MQKKQIISVLALLSVIYIILFCFPNAANSADISMVQVFEADEAMPLPYVFHMIEPYDSLKLTLYNFAYYNYYFYGFPYFAWSALVLLPVKWAGQIGNIPLVMLVLRQLVSLLPMLAAIWMLIYLQTRFKSWKAIPLFILLSVLPAVVENNFWWHPDGLVIFMMMLAVFFLTRDNLRFGFNFYACAVLCGAAAMTKGIGFYFFLSVAVYLLIGLLQKTVSFKKLLLSAAGFLAVMAGAYFITNPILVYGAERERYFEIMRDQSELLTQGYELVYEKGLAASAPVLTKYYGGVILLLAGLAAGIRGALRGPNRLLSIIILAWVIPLFVLVFFLIHFKFPYWLPAALPLFSLFTPLLPDQSDFKKLTAPGRNREFWGSVVKAGLGIFLLVQVFLFIRQDVVRFDDQLHKSENNRAVAFYHELSEALVSLPANAYRVYYDPRMYVPADTGWTTNTRFEMLDYPYIEECKYDMLLIMQSRVNDYLNPNAQAVNEAKMALAREFYTDVRDGMVDGYRLVYRTDYGLAFVTEELYQQYFVSSNDAAATQWPACQSCQP